MNRQPENGSKPISSETEAEGPSLVELGSYNSKRQEFDPEYDNDAEKMLADIEFIGTATKDERELKLRMLLVEWKRGKDVILERNLLHPNPFERDLSTEERALCRSYDVYMRFHSKEEHQELLQTVISKHRTLKRLQELKEARVAGCRTITEANRYLELKKRREEKLKKLLAEHEKKRVRQATCSPTGHAFLTHLNDLEIMKFHEVKLIFDDEKRLCTKVKLPSPLYLMMQEVISKGVFNDNVTKKANAHKFFKIDVSIVDRVYDMLVKKGLALA
ncbi:hypothetical protein Dsin_012779 [Dipteronia sinensis]|uniref:SWIRM domain-containing protein n=1 Tax=Dipteronia sinensis TaxID=43782 RepID=A0AAE0AJX8_9ROSI|nr:hypothetical protein Dsin_012779 [Dipteronia sinensis]